MSFDDLLKDLQSQRTTQEQETTIQELFNEKFMKQYSVFNSFDAFVEDGNFQVKSMEDIDKIPEELFDRHVDRKTDFPNWKSMLEAAKRELANG